MNIEALHAINVDPAIDQFTCELHLLCEPLAFLLEALTLDRLSHEIVHGLVTGREDCLLREGFRDVLMYFNRFVVGSQF